MSIILLLIVLLFTFVYGIFDKKEACSIDAAFTWVNNGRLYFLKDDKYGRWDGENNRLEYVASIRAGFPGMPHNVDAVVTSNGKNYVFRGCNVWVSTDGNEFEGPFVSSQLTLGQYVGTYPSCGLDGAVTWSEKRTFVFKGSKVYEIEMVKKQNMNVKDKGKDVSGNWHGLPDNIDAGFQWGRNEKTYIFKGEYYWRFGKWSRYGDSWTVQKGWPGLTKGLLPECYACDCNNFNSRDSVLKNITYDYPKAQRTYSNPEVIKKIINDNSESLTKASGITVEVSKEVTEMKMFSHTKGASFSIGWKFSVKVPFIGIDMKTDIRKTSTETLEYGGQNEVKRTESTEIECPGVPKKSVLCTATIRSAKIKVPYTIEWTHKRLGCECESRGEYTGVSYSTIEVHTVEK